MCQSPPKHKKLKTRLATAQTACCKADDVPVLLVPSFALLESHTTKLIPTIQMLVPGQLPCKRAGELAKAVVF